MIEWRASCLILLVWVFFFFVQRMFGPFSFVWFYGLNKGEVVFQLSVCRKPWLTAKIWHWK